jgi:hypothetical protein
MAYDYVEKSTNVTLLIPKRKVYCDFSIRLMAFVAGREPDMSGSWEEITWKATPVRKDYARFNFFVEKHGDAYMDRTGATGFFLFLFPFGTRTLPTAQALTRIDMEVMQNAFSPGKETWAKKALLTPQMEEIIAIFWS